jgi:hypothetical protein
MVQKGTYKTQTERYSHEQYINVTDNLKNTQRGVNLD